MYLRRLDSRIKLFFFFLFVLGNCQAQLFDAFGANYRGDTSTKQIYLVFTAHEFGEGLPFILKTLKEKEITASFFFTGDFVRNNKELVLESHRNGNFVGGHSDKHLLYCDWENRELLLESPGDIKKDIRRNQKELQELGIDAQYFMPPYEWYNKAVCDIASSLGLQVIQFSSGTYSNADYTSPEMKNYRSSAFIESKILEYESKSSSGLNGFYLLIHAGTDPKRTDKLYNKLPHMIDELAALGYEFKNL